MGLDALIAVQYGVARRDQLLRAGIAPEIIKRRLDRGEWQDVLPGVYALFAEPPDVRRKQVAGWLYAGPRAQLAGPTAARLYGLRSAPADSQIHVLVPHHRQVSSAGFAVIHRTVRLEVQPQRIEPIEVCSVSRALADTARWSPDTAMLRALVSEAVDRRFTTVAALRDECVNGPRNGSGALRAALDELVAGTCSEPEQDLRTALLQSRILPEIVWNPHLVGHDGQPLPWIDGWIDDVGIGLEVDASVDDVSPDDWEHAMRRHALLAGYGVLLLHFPPTRLRRDPTGVRLAVERAYGQRRACGGQAAVSVVRNDRRGPAKGDARRGHAR